MNIFQVSYKNLFRRKTRTAFTIFGIMLSIWVLVTLLGFNKGYENSLNNNIEGMGFQIVLTAKGCPYEAATLLMQGGAGLRYMSQEFVDGVAEMPEVAAATPMLMHAVFDPDKGDHGSATLFLGIDPVTYPAMKSYQHFFQGGWFDHDARYEVVLGYEAAELEQREVGDLMLLPGIDDAYTVVGILGRTGTQDDGTVYLPLRDAQRVFGLEGELTMLGMRLNANINQAAFEDTLYKLPDVQVVSMEQVRTTIMNLVGSAKAMVLAIALIAFLIAMFGVLNTVLMSVFERYQEIGILKSMGAMPRDIFKMVLIETTILCSVGGIMGIVFSWVFSGISERTIRHFMPFVPSGSIIAIDANIAILAFVSITLIGIVGGMYPAWRASCVRPLDSIRSE